MLQQQGVAGREPAAIDLDPGSQGLDLDSVEIPANAMKSATATGPGHSRRWAALLTVAMLVLIGGAVVAGHRGRATAAPRLLDLSLAPLSAKLVATSLLLIYGLTHALAAITVYLDTRVVYASTAEYFRFLSPARLTALSHAHLMAIATMDGLAALVYATSRRSDGLTCGVVVMTFVAIVADIGAWWLIKYAGAGFEWLSIAAGILLTLGFLVMTVSLLRSTWQAPREVRP